MTITSDGSRRSHRLRAKSPQNLSSERRRAPRGVSACACRCLCCSTARLARDPQTRPPMNRKVSTEYHPEKKNPWYHLEKKLTDHR